MLQLCTDATKAPWQQTQKNISQPVLSRLVFICTYYVVYFCSVSCQSITGSIWVGVILNKYSKSMLIMQYLYIPWVLLWCILSISKHQWLVSSTTSVTCLVAFDWNRNSLLIRPKSLWQWYIKSNIMFLDIIHWPVFV
jgi:hypothetical protein